MVVATGRAVPAPAVFKTTVSTTGVATPLGPRTLTVTHVVMGFPGNENGESLRQPRLQLRGSRGEAKGARSWQCVADWHNHRGLDNGRLTVGPNRGVHGARRDGPDVSVLWPKVPSHRRRRTGGDSGRAESGQGRGSRAGNDVRCLDDSGKTVGPENGEGGAGGEATLWKSRLNRAG